MTETAACACWYQLIVTVLSGIFVLLGVIENMWKSYLKKEVKRSVSLRDLDTAHVRPRHEYALRFKLTLAIMLVHAFFRLILRPG